MWELNSSYELCGHQWRVREKKIVNMVFQQSPKCPGSSYFCECCAYKLAPAIGPGVRTEPEKLCSHLKLSHVWISENLMPRSPDIACVPYPTSFSPIFWLLGDWLRLWSHTSLQVWNPSLNESISFLVKIFKFQWSVVGVSFTFGVNWGIQTALSNFKKNSSRFLVVFW